MRILKVSPPLSLIALATTLLLPAAHAQTLTTFPDQGFTPVYNFINSATKTLDMTMYELVDTTTTENAFIGSENISVDSLTENRELGQTTQNATALLGLNTALTSDYQGGTLWTTK